MCRGRVCFSGNVHILRTKSRIEIPLKMFEEESISFKNILHSSTIYSRIFFEILIECYRWGIFHISLHYPNSLYLFHSTQISCKILLGSEYKRRIWITREIDIIFQKFRIRHMVHWNRSRGFCCESCLNPVFCGVHPLGNLGRMIRTNGIYIALFRIRGGTRCKCNGCCNWGEVSSQTRSTSG
ncbi:MAG: hypothetical protein ACD_78C00452G0003 [uncultured bacterium (gcode 4)]|uniref:Uncharacterized protein n=1 Tax=uncultured bacterium (gcode 4) TaxID=1234023 RepID=K1YA42_9BACT|nr:MAG: hypothetical protein ACD_78C00452G0003 [uncultured bacterium (gcode 4)]